MKACSGQYIEILSQLALAQGATLLWSALTALVACVTLALKLKRTAVNSEPGKDNTGFVSALVVGVIAAGAAHHMCMHEGIPKVLASKAIAIQAAGCTQVVE